MPRIGLGTWRMSSDEAAAAVKAAAGAGYRLVDTAAAYANEEGVGRGLRECGVARAGMFVVTKLWNNRHGKAETRKALGESLERLGTDYVDLFLIHWPVPMRGLYAESWKTMVELRNEGLARSIGVSNFNLGHLDAVIRASGTVPAVNQIESHPAFPQAALGRALESRGICVQAWSPLGRKRGLADPAVARVAARQSLAPAQVLLAWHLAKGRCVIPKSSRPERMAENMAAADVALSPGDISLLDALDRGDAGRQGGDPEVFAG